MNTHRVDSQQQKLDVFTTNSVLVQWLQSCRKMTICKAWE